MLRDDGYYAEVVEHWCSFTRRRKDMFGFVDIVAMKIGEPLLLVQTTSGANTAARKTKILESEVATLARACGHRIVVHGWRKLLVKRGGKAKRWACKEEFI